MFAKVATALFVAVIASTPAWAAQRENLDVFQDVSQQVLRYPHFTIFDSVHAQVDRRRCHAHRQGDDAVQEPGPRATSSED